MARREYKGAAVPTRLVSGIGAGDTSFNINSNSGWPTGGANGPFEAILEPDVQGKEEAVLVTNQSGGACTGVTRGIGDTAATAHGVGADGSVIHGTTKLDADEANRHINDITIDEHTQYMKADGTRHDLTARHSAGTVVPTAAPVAVGTGLAEGSGTTLARASHVHVIGSGAINASAMFAAGVVNNAALGADSVGASQIQTDAVGALELANASVDFANLVANRDFLIVQSSNPGAVGAGRFWYNTTAGKRALLRRNAGDTAWEVLEAYDWVGYVPTYPGVTLGNAVHFARYLRKGGAALINGFFRIGSTTSFGGLTNLSITLPTNAQAKDLDSFVGYPGTPTAEFESHGAARAHDDSAGVQWAAVGLVIHAGAGKALDRIQSFATGGTGAWNQTTPITWATNDRFTYFIEYEVATLEDANWV